MGAPASLEAGQVNGGGLRQSRSPEGGVVAFHDRSGRLRLASYEGLGSGIDLKVVSDRRGSAGHYRLHKKQALLIVPGTTLEHVEQRAAAVGSTRVKELHGDVGRGTNDRQPTRLGLGEAAQRLLGAGDAVSQLVALRSLAEADLYFTIEGGVGDNRPAEVVAQPSEQVSAALRGQERRRIEHDRLRGELEQPLTARSALALRLERWLRQPRHLREARDPVLASVLAERGEGGTPAEVHAKLVRSGQLSPVSVLRLVESGIAPHPPRQSSRAKRRTEQHLQWPGGEDVAQFAFDDLETLGRDVDDAISFTPLDDGRVRVDVHISGVDAFLRGRNDPLRKQASRQGGTLYLPDRTLFMLPEPLTRHASLDPAGAGQDSPAQPAMRVSLWYDAATGKRLRHEVQATRVRLREWMSYDQADEHLVAESDGPLARAWALTQRIRANQPKQRVAGQFEPEMKYRLDTDGRVQVTRIESTPARQLVETLMIEANQAAAEYTVQEGIDSLYRVHRAAKPGLSNSPSAASNGRPGGALLQAEYAVDPRPHAALGVQQYTHFTSPIRRFPDLVVSHQIAAHQAGQGRAYTRAELQTIARRSTSTAGKRKALSVASDQRAALLYLAQNELRQPLQAVFRGEDMQGRSIVRLVESGARGVLLGGHDPSLPLGTPLSLEVAELDASRGILQLKRAR